MQKLLIFVNLFLCYASGCLSEQAYCQLSEPIGRIPTVEKIEQLEADAQAIVQKCGGKIVRDKKTQRITEVDVAGNRASITDDDLIVVLQVPNLKKISISGGSLTSLSLDKLNTQIMLEELFLMDTTTNDAELLALTQNLQRLDKLTLRRLSKLSDTGLHSLSNLPKLRVLALLGLQTTGIGLREIPKITMLKSLDLRGCNQLSAEDYRKLAVLTNLTELKIGGGTIDEGVLRAVATLPNLTSLTVEDAVAGAAVWEELLANPIWVENITSLAFARMYAINDRVLEKLAVFKKLKSLSLRAAPVRGSFVDKLPSDAPIFTTLQTLGMTKNYATPDCIESLGKFKNLTKLDFSFTPMTSEKIEALATLKQLRNLILTECQLTDLLYEKLQTLKQLTDLDVSGNPAITKLQQSIQEE